MKWFHKGKDGGADSTSYGWWFPEIKQLFSIALLKFEGPGREAYHSHAFNSVSWLLKGQLIEYRGTWASGRIIKYLPSLSPIVITRDIGHKVDSVGTSWVLTFRGPWAKTWTDQRIGEAPKTLTWGRKEV